MLYLIRHGATQNNLAKPPLLQGSGANPDLSAEGHQQAEKTALQLAHLPIHAVYSSPLNRAMQTGNPIAQSHGVPCQSLPGLIEVDVGRWQDRHWEEIATNEPEAYENFIRDPATYPYAEGETFEDVSRRIQPVFVQLLERHLGQSWSIESSSRTWRTSHSQSRVKSGRPIVESTSSTIVSKKINWSP